MAKEMKSHNLLNFPALKELPNLKWETATAGKGQKKDANGKVLKDAEGKVIPEETWDYTYPVFTADMVPAIRGILGDENLAAILTDEGKVTYRSAPTEEKLMNDAIAALVRTGKMTLAEAKALFS